MDPDSICKKIKSAVAKKGNCGGKVSIRAYNKTIQESDSLCYAGVRLVNEGEFHSLLYFFSLLLI